MFTRGGRVLVLRDAEGRDINATGCVVRLLMRDDSAWVRLDSRHSNDAVHPFPAEDETRSTNILAWPEDCEPSK